MLKRDFTEEQNMFRDAYRKFLQQEIVPKMEGWREQGIVDREAFLKAGAEGFLMIWPDEEYGGMGLSVMDGAIVSEELAYGCTGISTTTPASKDLIVVTFIKDILFLFLERTFR